MCVKCLTSSIPILLFAAHRYLYYCSIWLHARHYITASRCYTSSPTYYYLSNSFITIAVTHPIGSLLVSGKSQGQGRQSFCFTWPNVGQSWHNKKSINDKALLNINFNNQTYLYTISVTINAIASFVILPLRVRECLPNFRDCFIRIALQILFEVKPETT